MPLIPFNKMLGAAIRGRYAVGYFEAWNQDSLEAVLSAAEEADSPVIIGFGPMTVNQDWFEDWGLDYFAAIGKVAVARSRVPVCFILNEAQTYEQCLRGITLGFNIVMLDSSHLSFADNLEITRELVRVAHANGVAVEAELGRLPEAGKDSAGSLTDPEEAREFVQATRIDALAVSIGNVHLLIQGKADIDLGLLEKIRQACEVPLVIHGGSGFPPGLVTDCIDRGVAKFNVGTVLKREYYAGIRANTSRRTDGAELQRVVGSREKSDFTYEGKMRVKEKVKEMLRLYGSAGRSEAADLHSTY